MRSAIKSAVGRVLAATGLVTRGLRGAAVIAAFHRVNPRTADPLTRSPSDYEGFCRFFRTHFDVVPLSEMIRRFETKAPTEGLLAITHDDGYLDNYEYAAPILHGLGLPATFFVSTQFIGSNTVPPWDASQPARLPWMTWDHVREMQAMGFEFGSHTCSHPDLGRISDACARRELTESRRVLERELGRPVELFAYPFGGPRNIRAGIVKLVREVGYRCCLSSHGGVAQDGTDTFSLPRVPISPWYADPSQLAFALGLGRA